MRKKPKCMVKVHFVRITRNQPVGNRVFELMRNDKRRAKDDLAHFGIDDLLSLGLLRRIYYTIKGFIVLFFGLNR